MGVPLTTLTQKPVQYNTFHFGGDDTSLGKSGVFGTVAEWGLNQKNDTFKANLVFLAKKVFAFLDSIGLGACCFGADGLKGKLNESEYYQTTLARGAQARMKIVTAFGGEAVCNSVAVVSLRSSDLECYLKLKDNLFQRGQWLVQGEDPAGRKFAAMRVIDRTNGQVHVYTVHQRYRETCMDGGIWTTNIDDDSQMVRVGTNHACKFIKQICTSRHERFSIAPKT